MNQQAAANFLADGGVTGKLIRELDWSASPLGSPDTWPQSLRSVVGLLLTSKFPMFVAWGTELCVLYNDAYADILGAKHPLALGRCFYDIWAEIWLDISPLVEATLAGKAVYHEDLSLVLDRNGTAEKAWFTFSYSPVRDESGQIAGIFCAVTETTDKVVAVQRNAFLVELSDRVQNLRNPQAVVDSMAEALGRHLGGTRAGYGEVEADGVRVNFKGGWQAEGIASMTGYHHLTDYEETFLDRHRAGRAVVAAAYDADPGVTAGFAPAQTAAEARIQIVAPLIKAGRLAALLFVYASEPRYWTDTDQALAEDVAERIWSAVERTRAVTALHVSENRLRELNESLESKIEVRTSDLACSEARFRAYFNASPEYLFLARVPPGGSLVFEGLNPAGERLYGLPRNAIIGHAPAAVLDPETAADVERLARECLQLAQPLHYEAVRQFHSGRTLVLDVVVAPLPTPAPGDALVLFCKRDVTEQRRAEEALRQSQKMEAVGQLTGGIAHDFNNMLQVIGGSLEMMHHRVEQGRTEDLPRHLDNARMTVTQASAMTHRLLAFARRQPLEPKRVEADRLILGMMELMRQTVGPAVAIEFRAGDGSWPVLCDPNQLESALLNMAINARDAMPGGGQLIIALRQIEISNAACADDDKGKPETFVEIAVTDTGTGMNEVTRARVFEPFFTTKPVGQGTGLGLSQIYGFARQSGGLVQLDSILSQGTTVRLLLPKPNCTSESGLEPPQVTASELDACRASTTVLLVEDDAGVRTVAAEHLREIGFHVLEVEDGPAALRILHSKAHIDILVTDVGLAGGLSGRQVADAAREYRPSLPTLFITGYTDDAPAGQLTPGMEMIGKPFALDFLAAKVQSMVDAG